MDDQFMRLLGSLQGLSDRLALEGRFTDAAVSMGAIQALRALRTRLEPPSPPPVLELVPAPEQGAG